MGEVITSDPLQVPDALPAGPKIVQAQASGGSSRSDSIPGLT